MELKQQEEYIVIGHTLKAHGAKGELKIMIKEAYHEDLLQSEVVFINVKGKPLPFFIEGFRETSDILIKLEGIDTPHQAAGIASKEMYLRINEISYPANSTENHFTVYSRLEGFKVIDVNIGELGIITEILTFPQHEIALVQLDDKEVLVPLNGILIRNIIESEKTILMDLPEGLLEL
jgi:16S rRNA processing protein RimM